MADTDAGVEKSEAALREEVVLAFWAKNDIVKKSFERDSPKGEFVFYEGPPTANAKPALHHLEARAFKDAIPRYKTMQGYHVRRKAGWDTHGLPVELQIEKELGFTGKPDIEKYGVEAFNKKCRESVLKYIGVWENFTDRIGYWVDKADAYYTFDNTYIESLWSIVAKVYADDRMYKDYKVVPWCSRCGTALSSHELAQGYKDVKDLSVTAMFELTDEPGTFVLAWTTTPWTLPGNVGLAVGKDIEYVKIFAQGQRFILAKERLSIVAGEYAIEQEFKGISLAGRTYKPLYPYLATLVNGEAKAKMANAYKIYLADFVTTTDGTGIVHTAVMYGQEDFELGTQVGLPKFHLVKPDGKFVDGTDFLAGRFVRDEEVAVDIIKDLAHRGVLFSKEKYEHTYPFCWRCSTPLIYYARDSWYIRMSDLRDTLVVENEKINWEPAHIREGRFGEWVANVKDWAISRERYWGTPLPVWQSADGKERVVIGSLDELKRRTKKSGNKYFAMRHGQTASNGTDIIDDNIGSSDTLTDVGRAQAVEAAENLKKENVSLIVYSPYARTKETAEIVREALGLSADLMVEESRLGEIKTNMTGKTWRDYFAQFPGRRERMSVCITDAENLDDVRKRAMAVLFDLESKYQNKNILIVTHEGVTAMLQVGVNADKKKMLDVYTNTQYRFYENAEIGEIPFVPFPHNEDYELDFHKPYIDQVTLIGDSGRELVRTPEVMDVWFDSGAMPFAQEHYPFDPAQGKPQEIPYPADFISEAIDQTRGWFYTLLAVGVLMGRGTPYKNVICLGHLLDDKGAKMSKSKGNVVEPFAAMDKHGVDLIRFWMYSVNPPGEGKNYDEKVLAEVKNKVFNPLQNALQFYSMYKDERVASTEESKHVLDRWILARMNSMLAEMTTSFDAYDILGASRPIRTFIEDFSTWYIRRSRDRFKGDDEADKQAALNTMHMVFEHVSRAMAPLTPFFAEDIYQSVRTDSDPESVHLADWPKAWKVEEELVTDMAEVRRVVSLALEARQKAGIKVRQPLAKLTANSPTLAGKTELLALIQDEVNVKEVRVDESVEGAVLDTNLTDELREEGELRDLIREVQDLRKAAGLSAKDKAVLAVGDKEALVTKHWEALAKATNLSGTIDGDFNVAKA